MEQRFILRLAEIDDIPSIMEIEQICLIKIVFQNVSLFILFLKQKDTFV